MGLRALMLLAALSNSAQYPVRANAMHGEHASVALVVAAYGTLRAGAGCGVTRTAGKEAVLARPGRRSRAAGTLVHGVCCRAGMD
jgi:hypothetical protein